MRHYGPGVMDRSLRRLMAQGRRHRRLIAASLACLAVLCALSVLRPAPEATITALAAATDLPAGTVLRAEDLASTEVPVSYPAPGAIVDLDAVDGRLLSAPMLAGEVLTQSRLVQSSSPAAGTLAVPVRLADAEVAGLLEPGMTLDLVSASGEGRPTVVAESVRIITVPRRSGAFGSNADRGAGSLLLVAADRATAIRLAAASTEGGLSAILH